MRHLQISVDVTRWPDERLEGLFTDTETGTALSPESARQILRKMKAAGYRVVPCDTCECEVDGTCTGIPKNPEKV